MDYRILKGRIEEVLPEIDKLIIDKKKTYNVKAILKNGDEKYISSFSTELELKSFGDKVKEDFNLDFTTAMSHDIAIDTSSVFDINQKFDFLSKLTQMVIHNFSVSLIITGDGGLGKSFTVEKELNNEGMIENEQYVIMKGFSTAKGLYRYLFENNGKIIIFDDCDSILEDSTAKNILKSALDSYKRRFVTWNSELSKNDDLPRSFEFTGRVICISNKEPGIIDSAIRSRSLLVDVFMTTDEKFIRMETILPEIEPEVEMEYKRDALDLLIENRNILKELNFRTLIKVIKIRRFQNNWKDLATYAISL
jgi:hypothetical protein